MKLLQYAATMLAVLMMAGTPKLSAAESDQLYFVGMSAPLGSISLPGQTKTAVYLRWDVVEGILPPDVISFVLKRSDGKVWDFPAVGTLKEAEIKALYDGAEQERRRREIVAWLNREAQESASPSTVDESNFAAAIYAHLNAVDGMLWAMMASRVDFNIARARYRGYLDTEVTAGQAYTYELIALSDAGVEVKIGEVTVTAGAFEMLDAVSDLAQVRGVARCDAPERFKEHGTLYLNWSHPGGENGVTAFVNGLLIAGYDLYRTKTAALPGYGVDLREMASGVMHDADGSVVVSDELEKVNEQPIMIAGTAVLEETKKGWNPPFTQYMELPEALHKHGVNPGDTRYYYLVARDFTGNYGKTAAIQVTIPDLTPPPAPWAVWTTKYSAKSKERFKLLWKKTDVANYRADHQTQRNYCNLPTARLDKQLRFVPAGGSCERNATLAVSLDPYEYIVYRFDTVEEAEKFSDSDGDGYSDLDERIPLAGNADLNLTDLGTACDQNAHPAAVNHIAATVKASSARMSGGQAVLEFTDAVLAANRDKFYWYRIATRDHDAQGALSTLSAPVRAFFPRRNPPARVAPGTSVRFGTPHCDYQASFIEDTDPETPIFSDLTLDADYVAVSCSSDVNDFLLVKKLQLGGKAKEASLQSGECEVIAGGCGKGGLPNVSYYDRSGKLLDSVSMEGFQCDEKLPQGNIDFSLTKSCSNTAIDVIGDGDVTPGPILLDPGVTDACIKVWYTSGGATYLDKTICPPFTLPLELAPPSMGAGDVCYSFSVQNANAESSSVYHLPCFVYPMQTNIFAPNGVGMSFTPGTNIARLEWIPPQQEIVGTILEWYLKGADVNDTDAYFTQFVPYDAEAISPIGAQELEVTVGPEPTDIPDWQQQWCFRSRAVGRTGGGSAETALSPWSEARCSLRQPAGAAPTVGIEWPRIPVPGSEGALHAEYLVYNGVPAVVLSDEINYTDGSCNENVVPLCDPAKGTACLGKSGGIIADCPDFCRIVNKSLQGVMNFVVYRQSSDDATTGTAGEFIQVSPLIEKLHCTNGSVLSDPFMTVVNFSNYVPVTPNWRAIFLDQFPHEVGKYYRYQIVYFGADGEISGYKSTGWIASTAY